MIESLPSVRLNLDNEMMLLEMGIALLLRDFRKVVSDPLHQFVAKCDPAPQDEQAESPSGIVAGVEPPVTSDELPAQALVCIQESRLSRSKRSVLDGRAAALPSSPTPNCNSLGRGVVRAE